MMLLSNVESTKIEAKFTDGASKQGQWQVPIQGKRECPILSALTFQIYVAMPYLVLKKTEGDDGQK